MKMLRSKTILAALALCAVPALGSASQAQTIHIGDVIMVGFNYCPREFAQADGRTLSTQSFDALYSILGCTYGGDCETTFALPDLRGRIPIHLGQMPGSSVEYQQGERAGAESLSLSATNLAPHRHTLRATNAGNDAASPDGNAFTLLTGADEIAYNSGVNIAFEDDTFQSNGSNLSIGIVSESMAIRYCVSLYGAYPYRN